MIFFFLHVLMYYFNDVHRKFTLHNDSVLEISFSDCDTSVLDVFENDALIDSLSIKFYDLATISSVDYDETKPSVLCFNIQDVKTHEVHTILIKGCQNQLSFDWLPVLIHQSQLSPQNTTSIENENVDTKLIQHAFDSVSQMVSNTESLNSKNIDQLNSVLRLVYFRCRNQCDEKLRKLLQLNIGTFESIIKYCRIVMTQFIAIQFPQELTQTDKTMLNRCLECIESSVFFIS